MKQINLTLVEQNTLTPIGIFSEMKKRMKCISHYLAVWGGEKTAAVAAVAKALSKSTQGSNRFF